MLPIRIAAIGGNEALGDGKAVAIGLEHLFEVPPSYLITALLDRRARPFARFS
jgi:hypothetical protein